MRSLVFLLGLLCIGTQIRADEPTGNFFDGTPIDCPGATSEVHWENCSYHALAQADQALNALYQRLLKLADDEEMSKLREMQRAWIQLKKSQCEWVLSYHEGATNPGKFNVYCEAVMTIRRVKELEQLGTGLLWRAAE